MNWTGRGFASGRSGIARDGSHSMYGSPMPPISNRVRLRAAPLGSTWNCPSILSGAATLARVSSVISTWPPVVKDSTRPARFTVDPTAAYFVRRSDPMFPTITRPVCIPMPISSCTPSFAASRRLTSVMASCMLRAQATAFAAWSSRATGAPKMTRIASPMISSMVPSYRPMTSTIVSR
jgi:hypothetical protein